MNESLSSAPSSATVSTGDTPHIIAPGASSAAGGLVVPRGSFSFAIPPAERVRITRRALDEADLRLICLRRIHEARNRTRESELCAVQMRGRRGFSAKRLLSLYYEFVQANGDWRLCVDKAKSPLPTGLELSARRRLEFLDWARSFLLLNQREKLRPRYRKLMERLEVWRQTGRREHAIPGYDAPPPNAPGLNHPAGWSYSQLVKLCQGTPFEKRALAVGRGAAADFRPMVLTTRAKLKVGQIFYFDDNEHDMKVRHITNMSRVMRPLEFACLDGFSGCFVANVFKPTLYDELEEKRIKLRSAEFLWLAVHWLLDIGWREDTGTTLVAEHGTAKFPAWFQDKVRELTGGKVRFEEGAVDRRAACEGFFKARARGNFRTKSPLESMFNLVRNETSDLLLFPGQVGMDRDRSPEELDARERHELDLARAELILSRDGLEKLRHDFLEWNQWRAMAFEVYAKINRRGGPGLEWWTHEIEGWVEAGLVANEFRLRNGDSFTGWMDSSALTQGDAHTAAIRALLHADPVNLTRVRKLSPWEVWQRGARELTRAPLYWLPLILPLEMGRPVRVAADHTIEFSDQSISPDKLRFIARARDVEGRETVLRPGAEYIGFINQFNPQAIYLCDERGRGVGECPFHGRVDRGDDAAVAEKNREVRRIEAELLQPVAKAGAELAARRAENAAHNAAVLQHYCPDGAPAGPLPTQEEQDLAALASAAFASNEIKGEENE